MFRSHISLCLCAAQGLAGSFPPGHVYCIAYVWVGWASILSFRGFTPFDASPDTPPHTHPLLWAFWFQVSDEEEWAGSPGPTYLEWKKKAKKKHSDSLSAASRGPCSPPFWPLGLHESLPCWESPFWAHRNIRWWGLNPRARSPRRQGGLPDGWLTREES